MERFDLKKFEEAHELAYTYVLEELKEGSKRTHWMWYIFPQLKGLGFSYNAKCYGITCREEATAFIEHPMLGLHLRELCEVLLELPDNDATAIFGAVDAKKLRSSMTLFDIVSPNNIFSKVLDKYFDGVRDDLTNQLID